MASVCGIPLSKTVRVNKQNWIAAQRNKDTEHEHLMKTCPEYRAACQQEDTERKTRVDTMAKRSNGSNGKVTAPKVGEYKGYPTLTLPNGSRHGFTFGLSKARAILDHLDAIRAFVGEETGAGEDRALASYVNAGLGEE